MKVTHLARPAAAVGLAFLMAVTGFAGTKAQAEMVSTTAAISKYQAYASKDRLMSELQSEEVRSEMIAMGVDPAEAEARLAAMTDEEIAKRLAVLDEDPAGATSIVGALLAIFLILLVTDLLCLTRVFKFVRTC